MIIKNNKWMLPKEAQEWIFTNISEGSTILELGSGYGTEELSKKYKMYSIEHDPNWIGCFNSTYIKAEIKNRFYNISEILDKIPKNIDLLIIDGPPSALGNRSKFLDVMSNFSLDFPIIINDANRNDEMYLLTSLTGKIGRESWLHTSKDGRKFGIIKGIKNKQINIESKTESIKEPSIIDGISVIISAYNTQDFIEECLDSVANQKTNLKYEVLLGIDGCKETLDKVKSIMSKYNNIDLHVYYSVENVGTYILCNSLIEKSKFNYFTRFDSDDIMKENHIEYNIKFLKDYNVVYPKANILNESRVIPTMGLVFMDKKIFLDINGYDNFRISGDNDLKERLKRNNNKIKDSDTPTLFRRILPNSLEHSKETNMQSELRKKINNEIRTRKVIKIDNLQVTKLDEIYEDPKIDGISVIISAYKSVEFIEECLDSVANQKTNFKYEVLLGIDGCEETLNKIKQIMNKYSHLDFHVYNSDVNVGVYLMFNSLIKKSKYNYFTVFGADDIMLDNHLEENCKYLNEYNCVLSKGLDIKINYSKNYDGIIFLNKDIFFSVNGFDEYRCGMDSDLLNRLGKKNISVYRNKILTYNIIGHDDSLTKSKNYGFGSEYRTKIKNIIFSRKNIILEKYNIIKLDKIINKDALIVSMTSWKNRINKAHMSIELLLNNTRKPDKFILNLSYEEFPNKEKELPDSILSLTKKYSNFEIYWVKENTKPYKKLIPTLLRYPNNPIITTDDDVTYPLDFIEKIYNTYLRYDKKYPISSGGTSKWEGDIYSHFGAGSLVTSDMFGKYLDDLYNNIVMKYGVDKIPYDDPIFTYAMLLNGKKYQFTNDINMSIIVRKDGNDKDSITKYGHEYLINSNKVHDIIKKYIKNVYNKTYEDLIKDDKKIDVYCASLWRDGHIIKTINSILKNKEVGTITIICNNYTDEQWSIINKEINDKRITLHRGNNEKGSCEKFRYIGYNNNYYISFIDDDLIYPENYYEYLISGVEKYNSIVSLHGRKMKENKIDNYYNGHMISYACLKNVIEDVEVDIIGNGVSLLKRDFFNDLDKWYDYVTHPNMDDIYISYWAKKNNIKRIVLKHKEGYLIHKELNLNDDYIYEKYKNNCQFQTDFINKYFIKYG